MKIRRNLIFLSLLVLFMSTTIFAQDKSLGLFTANDDVGEVKKAGSSTYNARTEEYTLEGSGTNMWFKRDDFQFLWKELKGDFILTARAGFVGAGVDPHRKLGWIIRSSRETDAAQA